MIKRRFTRWLKPAAATPPQLPVPVIEQLLREDGRHWREESRSQLSPEQLQRWLRQMRQVKAPDPLRRHLAAAKRASGTGSGRAWRPAVALVCAGLLLLTAVLWQVGRGIDQAAGSQAVLSVSDSSAAAENHIARSAEEDAAGLRESGLLPSSTTDTAADEAVAPETAASAGGSQAEQPWTLSWSQAAADQHLPDLSFQRQTDPGSTSEPSALSLDLTGAPDLSAAQLTVWLTRQAVEPAVQSSLPAWTALANTKTVPAPPALTDSADGWDITLLFASASRPAGDSIGETVIWSGLADPGLQLSRAVAAADPAGAYQTVLLIRLQQQFIVLPLQLN
ncbi:MAG: hypothetical protein PHP39_00145 [Oscillospiraceae bacterium]|nr:hypothetical protein [Oscillospiraceae bacterium]